MDMQQQGDQAQNEQARLTALRTYEILDTPPEPVFDRLTEFAANICETPIATITMVDEHRQWFKSAIGLDISETDRAISFCTHTIRTKKPFVVHDAQRDPRFAGNPLVIGPPSLRFYAGVPLMAAGDITLGSLAVMDVVPRTLNQSQMTTLQMLAEQVMVHLELRRQRNELERISVERDKMNATLARQASHLREAQRIAGVGSWTLHIPTRCLTCSEEVYRIVGLAQTRETEELSAFMQSVHADDRERVSAAIDAAVKGKQPLDIVHRVVRPGGEVRHVHERGEPPAQENGGQIMAGTMQDITHQHRSQEQLRLLQACVARINDSVMITEAEPLAEPGPRIVFVNDAFERQTGYAREEVLGKSPRMLQGPHTQRAELDRIRAALEAGQPVSAELINYTKSGREFWQEIDIVPVADAAGRIRHFAAIERDISQRKTTAQEIERLAFYDPLTRLPNRRLLLDRLHHALAVAARNGHSGALLFIDLDNFKALNDTLGHDKGDLLLQDIARRLEQCVRRSNTVARLGGDEFVIMLEDLSRNSWEAAAQAEFVAEKALASFQAPFILDGYEYHSSSSIGVALFSKTQADVDELLKRADMAMYQAKASGRNMIRFFDPQMQAAVNARVALERDFRKSLQQQDFVLHYQPQTDGKGKVTGAEALVRWKHPRRGLVYPDTFIPLAEETGLIMQLGQWVLETACTQLAAWTVHPLAADWNLAVNVSARQFRHPDFVKQALTAMESAGIDPRKLTLELSESVLAGHVEETIARMRELKAHGVGFSLDDFGTGYSSLASLRRLPVDQLKIDQSFVQDVLVDPDDAAITQTIVALGRTLGLEVIAEGVEIEGQREFLERNGCHAYQGLLFSQPLPAEQIRA